MIMNLNLYYIAYESGLLSNNEALDIINYRYNRDGAVQTRGGDPTGPCQLVQNNFNKGQCGGKMKNKKEVMNHTTIDTRVVCNTV